MIPCCYPVAGLSEIDEICPFSNPKPVLHNINPHTKFNENLLTFTQVIIQKRKYGWRDGQTQRLPTWNHCVVGYKKQKQI